MKKVKSHMKWSWIFMIMFIVLSIIDIRFGLLGFICMTVPMYHAVKGRGKIHCSHYCPRGSILGKFLNQVSLNNNLPNKYRGEKVKNILLSLMIVVFSISLYHAFQQPNIIKAVGFSVFRLMMSSLTLGILMGVVFKPRSWCQVCPMGYATGLIRDSKNNNKKDNYNHSKAA